MALAFTLALIAVSSFLEGRWPFASLERRASRIELPNGAAVELLGTEDRGWRGKGYVWEARYREAGHRDGEVLAHWVGIEHDPQVFVVGQLVVFLSPDRRTVFVRTGPERRAIFTMTFPRDEAELASPFARYSSLSEEELRRLRADVDPDEARHSPYGIVTGFQPDTRDLLVDYVTNGKVVRHLRLELAANGEKLILRSVRKEILP